ncbi:MAG: hypothetical protein KIT86_03705 [Hydrogenophaga sp.]|nr:hypothetical protein [Hydrogenophaga sp.]MCW5668741.1 hypothetical protein [Hydrogenophaga sp.]
MSTDPQKRGTALFRVLIAVDGSEHADHARAPRGRAGVVGEMNSNQRSGP